MHSPESNGFTLIELSIVLVIIGLLVGGVLTGRDLIRAAEVRAQISQIEKYNTAVNAFRSKYDAMPGDLNGFTATTFGFTPRGPYPGQGDGNFVLEGNCGDSPGSNYSIYQAGEPLMFWVDLSYANGLNVNMIEGGFSSATPRVMPYISDTALSQYFPTAKLGRGNFVYVLSNGGNYYVISRIARPDPTDCFLTTSAGLSVQQAYSIDKKTDDGLATTGNVIAEIPYSSSFGFLNGEATDTATSCFKYSSGAYSISINSGAGNNCAISLQMQ